MNMVKLKFLALLFFPCIGNAASQNQAGLARGELGKLMVGLLVVLLFIFILSWLLKRLNGTKFLNSPGFKLIASMNLGAREKIVLVEAGGRFLLLGLTANSINHLHDFGTELPEAFISDTKASFKTFMKTALGKTEK